MREPKRAADAEDPRRGPKKQQNQKEGISLQNENDVQKRGATGSNSGLSTPPTGETDEGWGGEKRSLPIG